LPDLPLSTSHASGDVIQAATMNGHAAAINDRDGANLVGHAGTGVAATDHAMIEELLGDLPSVGGRAALQRGQYQLDSSQELVIPTGKFLVGAGGIAPGTTWPEATKAGTALLSSRNGSVVRMDGHSSGLHDLMLYGDTGQASQILLDLGHSAGSSPTSKFSIKGVHLKGAGLDNIRVRGLVLESLFELVYAHGAERYNLYADGNQANANAFRSCLFREAKQWGARLFGGGGWHFDTCVFESNSQHASTAYGGLLMGGGTDYMSVNLTNCYFENNGGFDNSGKPWQMDAHGSLGYTMKDDGSYYAEDAACVMNDGYHVGIAVQTNLTTHTTMNAGAQGATFLDCKRWDGGDFTYSGASVAKAIRLDHGGAYGPRLMFGNDRLLQRNSSTGTWEMDQLSLTGLLTTQTYLSFGTALAAASAPVNSIFRDSADNVLKKKDNSGTTTALSAGGGNVDSNVFNGTSWPARPSATTVLWIGGGSGDDPSADMDDGDLWFPSEA
jgi:hypothetical protein